MSRSIVLHASIWICVFFHCEKSNAQSFPNPKRTKPTALDDTLAKQVSKAELKIEKALQAETKFDFVDTPILDVFDYIAEAHQIPIEVDITALEDEGYDKDLPFTAKYKNRSLRSALSTLLGPYKLVFLIKDEALLITSKEAVKSEPERFTINRLYDISGLVKEGDDSIPKSIQKTIDSRSWLDPHGDPGELTVVKTNNKTVLSITHLSEHHYKVATFLRKLRVINEK